MRCDILDGAHPLGEFGIVPSALMFDRLDECTCDEEFPDALSVQVKNAIKKEHPAGCSFFCF